MSLSASSRVSRFKPSSFSTLICFESLCLTQLYPFNSVPQHSGRQANTICSFCSVVCTPLWCTADRRIVSFSHLDGSAHRQQPKADNLEGVGLRSVAPLRLRIRTVWESLCPIASMDINIPPSFTQLRYEEHHFTGSFIARWDICCEAKRLSLVLKLNTFAHFDI